MAIKTQFNLRNGATDMEIKKKIEEYVSNLLYQHDMASWRNENNQKRMDRVVAKCMEDLESHNGLLELLQNENQIEYFVRQTILYMV